MCALRPSVGYHLLFLVHLFLILASFSLRATSNDGEVKKYERILQEARNRAHQYGYRSAPSRALLRTEFIIRNKGLVPYPWQVDIAEALHLGLDCTLIAGTVAGKTMPFVMPLFLAPEKSVIVISPLNALEEDQAVRFRSMGFTAVAVNGETYSNAMHKELKDNKYQVIVTSPDMCLKHDRFRQLLASSGFAGTIAAIIIDEAHCISQWGEHFRTVYAELGTLRAFVPMHIPFLATSATLTPLVLAQVRDTLHIQTDMSYHVNLGNDRPNIAWFLHVMNGAKSDLEALSFLVSSSPGSNLPPDDPNYQSLKLTQTMVFFDDINVALQALKWLRNKLPRHLHNEVVVYNSRRSPYSKRRVLEDFRCGKIKILLTTEAAGMGCDLPHVEQVVQFMVPSTLSIWMQRAGRGGRDGQIFARAILLVQPSVFQEVNQRLGNGTDKNDMPTKYRKDVEEGLREWMETNGCRREIADKYFGSVVIRSSPTGICCDNCLRKASPYHPLLSITTPSFRPMLMSHPSEDPHDDEVPSDELNQNGKRRMGRIGVAANRRDGHLRGAEELLRQWRYDTWRALYRKRPWGIQCLLPDTILTSFATKARLDTINDLINAGWSPTHTHKHGEEVLVMLHDYDWSVYEERKVEKVERAKVKKEETRQRQLVKKAARKAEQQHLRILRNAQPKTPRPSRSKQAMATSYTVNTDMAPTSNNLPFPGLQNIPPLPLSTQTPAAPSSAPHNLPAVYRMLLPSHPSQPHHFRYTYQSPSTYNITGSSLPQNS